MVQWSLHQTSEDIDHGWLMPTTNDASRWSLSSPHVESHAGDAVARIHVNGLTRDPAGQIAQQEGGGAPHLHLGDRAAQRSFAFDVVNHVENAADGGAGQGADRPGTDRIDPHLFFRAELSGEIAHGGLQGRLGHTHHVVIGDGPLSPEVGEGDHAGLFAEQRLGMGTERSQGVSTDIQGAGKAIGGCGAVIADQFLFASKGQAVNQAIEYAPLLLDLVEHSLHLGGVLHVEWQKQAGLEGLGEFTYLGLKAAFVIGQVGDTQLSTSGLELLGNAPSDGAVIGDAGNEDLLAGEIEQHRGGPAGRNRAILPHAPPRSAFSRPARSGARCCFSLGSW